MKARKLGWILAVLVVISLACSLSGTPDSGIISVEISSPAEGATVQVGQEVFVVASAIAEQGVAKVYLSVNGQIVGTEEPVDLPQAHVTNFSWVPVAEGSVVLSVVATDGAGAGSEPVSVTVTIQAASGDDSENTPAPSDTPSPTGAPTNTPQPTETDTPPTPTFTLEPSITPTVTPSPTTGIGVITLVIPPGIVFLLPTVETVWEQVSIPANGTGSVTATCPSGTLALGGGNAGSSDVYIYTQSRQGNGWQVYGANKSGSAKLVNSYVVCISNVAGGAVAQVHNQITAPANTYGHAVVSCPAGTTVVGGGWATNSTGTLRVYNTSRKDNGWQVYADNSKSTGQLMNVYAICLSSDSTISSSQVVGHISIPSGASKGQQATCPSGDYATGGGFALSADMLNYNTSPEDGTTWEAYAKNTGGSAKQMNVYAICLSFD